MITLDTDWAPDFVIDYVASLLADYKVSATWFVTHSSPAIDRLKGQPELFELGIHPNFLKTSTQGRTPEEILEYLLTVLPEAVSCRMHSGVQSTHLLSLIMSMTRVKVDVTVLLFRAEHLYPVEHHWRGRSILRIPFFWEDDFEMEQPEPSWSLRPQSEVNNGLRIFNFHPIHVFLNSCSIKPYHSLRDAVRPITNASRKYVESLQNVDTAGTRDVFMQLIQYLAGENRRSLCIRDLARDRLSNKTDTVLCSVIPETHYGEEQ